MTHRLKDSTSYKVYYRRPKAKAWAGPAPVCHDRPEAIAVGNHLKESGYEVKIRTIQTSEEML